MHHDARPVQLRRWFGGAALAIVLTVTAGSCSTGTAPSGAKGFGGRLVISAGGGALAQIGALTKRFTELHPGVIWDIENVGSDAGISLVASHHSDLGAISRDLAPAEQGTVALEPLGIVGTAVAVNSENRVTGLTLAQVRQAFSGELTNWTQLGGADLPIRVFLRDPTSSTRQSFDEFVFPGRQPTYAPAAATLGSNAEMASAIHSFAGGIAMMTLKQGTVADPKIRLLSIDSVPATIAALNDGSYKIRRPLYLVYPVAAAGMKPDVKLFLDFVRSSEGQRILGGF